MTKKAYEKCFKENKAGKAKESKKESTVFKG